MTSNNSANMFTVALVSTVSALVTFFVLTHYSQTPYQDPSVEQQVEVQGNINLPDPDTMAEIVSSLQGVCNGPVSMRLTLSEPEAPTVELGCPELK